jgi:hypothetical protein
MAKRTPKETDVVLNKKIAHFITVDGSDLSNIRVDFDKLSLFLIKEVGRRFSVSKFEKMLKQEMEHKLLGRLFDEKSMNALTDYINQLTKYLTKEMHDVEQGRHKAVSERPGGES